MPIERIKGKALFIWLAYPDQPSSPEAEGQRFDFSRMGDLVP